jgi:thiopeptide-type bacteriocin biosynthesis protein
MAISEKIFQLDSEAALKLVQLLSGDQGADARWRLAIRGMDLLLQDLQLDLKARLEVVKSARETFGKEFRVDGSFEYQLGEKYRKNRSGIEALLSPTPDQQNPLSPGFAILRARSEQIAPVATELWGLEKSGRLQTTIFALAQSYLHMHANRMLRSAARAQELVMYDFLTRTYESRLARARKPGGTGLDPGPDA